MKNLLFTLFTVFLLGVSSRAYGEDPCPSVNDERNPISDQRPSGAFSASHMACENDDPEFFIQDRRLLRSIDDDVELYCSRYETEGVLSDGREVCTNGRFNFVAHSEQVLDFVEHLKESLSNQLTPPPSLGVTGAEADHVRALMYLCTRYKLEQAQRILTSDANDEHKKRVITALADLGILGHFLRTQEGRNFLANQAISEDVRTHAVESILKSPNSPEKQIQFFLSLQKLLSKRGDGALSDNERNLLNTVNTAFTNYLSLSPAEQSSRTLNLMNSAEVPGAAEAVGGFLAYQSDRGTQETAVAPSPEVLGEGVRVVPTDQVATPRNTFPNCSETDPLTVSNQQEVIGVLDQYMRRNSGRSGFPEARDNVRFWSWYEEVFTREDLWANIELHLDANSNESGNLLTSGRRFYCFMKKTTQDYDTLKAQIDSGNVSQELADQIFSSISEVNAGDTFASMIALIAPYLSQENKLIAIETINRQISTGSTSGPQIEERRRWRTAALRTIIDRHLEQYPMQSDSPVILRSIDALANNASLREEQYLAQLFVDIENEGVRNRIISKYNQASLINATAGNPNIFRVIREVQDEERRNRYLRNLALALNDVKIGTRQQFRDFATDNNAVSGSVLTGLLTEIQTLTTEPALQDQLAEQLANTVRESEGITLEENRVGRPRRVPVDSGPSLGGGSPNTLTPVNSYGGGYDIVRRKPRRINAGDDSVDGLETNSEMTRKPNIVGDSYITNLGDQFQGGGAPPLGLSKAELNGGGGLGRREDSEAPEEVPLPGIDNQNVVPFVSDLGRAIASASGIAPANNLFGSNAFPQPIAGGSFSNSFSQNYNATRAAPTSKSSDTRSVGDQLRDYQGSSNSKSDSDNSRDQARKASDQELIQEIRQITRDTSRLRDRIDNLDVPTIAPRGPQGTGPQTIETSQVASRAQSNGQIENGTPNNDANSAVNNGRGPASVPQSGAPAGAAATDPNGATGTNLQGDVNQSLLSPYTDPSQEDLSKIIIVRLEEEKNLLRNYMAAKESMTCPELRFVQNFYEKHIDNFILSKRRKPWREYALLELDGMNFRFNYPGAVKMRLDIKESCATLSGIQEGTVGQSNRSPATSPDGELVPEEALPAQEEQGIIKRFMLKLGL